MRVTIDETARISPKAIIGEGVEIGAYSIVGENVKIGKGTKICSHVVIDGWTEIGENCKIFSSVILGTEPQDVGYKDDKTYLKIGNNCVFREYVTINRGTVKGGGITEVGNDCYLMSYTHIGHDCKVGDGVVMVNNAGLAGHVYVGNKTIISGLVAVHQFVRIGAYSIISAHSALNKDVVPYAWASGRPARVYSINMEGLKRNGFSRESRDRIKKAYKFLFESGMNTSQSVEAIKKQEDLKDHPEIKVLLDFIKDSKRGICRMDEECLTT